MALSPLDELRERAAEVRFCGALCALAILRYLTDHSPRLSLSVLARIVSAAAIVRWQPAMPSSARQDETHLPLCLHSSLLQASTNDTALALLPLLERPPWVRRGRGGALQRCVGSAWHAVPPADRQRLGQYDGQVCSAACGC